MSHDSESPVMSTLMLLPPNSTHPPRKLFDSSSLLVQYYCPISPDKTKMLAYIQFIEIQCKNSLPLPELRVKKVKQFLVFIADRISAGIPD